MIRAPPAVTLPRVPSLKGFDGTLSDDPRRCRGGGLRNIFVKLGVSSRVAVARAVERERS